MAEVDGGPGGPGSSFSSMAGPAANVSPDAGAGGGASKGAGGGGVDTLLSALGNIAQAFGEKSTAENLSANFGHPMTNFLNPAQTANQSNQNSASNSAASEHTIQGQKNMFKPR